MIPEISFSAVHDFIADRQQATSSFEAGGAAFGTKGAEPAKTTYIAGVGLHHKTASNTTITLKYDYSFRSQFNGHSGLLNIKREWA